MLKRARVGLQCFQSSPAAFGRLCVETKTMPKSSINSNSQPPSGGCVLKLYISVFTIFQYFQPPSGGCVLKPDCLGLCFAKVISSRLRAAVC